MMWACKCTSKLERTRLNSFLGWPNLNCASLDKPFFAISESEFTYRNNGDSSLFNKQNYRIFPLDQAVCQHWWQLCPVFTKLAIECIDTYLFNNHIHRHRDPVTQEDLLPMGHSGRFLFLWAPPVPSESTVYVEVELSKRFNYII